MGSGVGLPLFAGGGFVGVGGCIGDMGMWWVVGGERFRRFGVFGVFGRCGMGEGVRIICYRWDVKGSVECAGCMCCSWLSGTGGIEYWPWCAGVDNSDV